MKSILFFSMHRSGSTAQINILKNTADAAGLVHAFDYPAIEAFNQKKGTRVVHTLPAVKRLKTENTIYGPFRRPLAIDNLNDFKVILTLRDPKDTLVSLYYSDAFSHDPPPNPEKRKIWQKERDEAKRIGIDVYTIRRADFICEIYEAYIDMFSLCDDKVLLTYADMVTDFEAYLRKFLKFCGLIRAFDKVIPMKSNFKPPKKENIGVHKRQMLPNDHKRKLAPKTIQALDKKFSRVLKWMEKTSR